MKTAALRILRQAALIVLSATALGLVANRISPRGLPLVPPPRPATAPESTLTVAAAKALWMGGETLFLDAREPADYAAGHIANALGLPSKSFDEHFPAIAPIITFASPLVLYCDGKECELSHRLRASLAGLGYTNARVLADGWTAWSAAGLPTKKGIAP